MIKIGKPYIETQDNQVFLKCKIEDTSLQEVREYYYATSEEYGEYFVTEIADPFVYAAILPAILSEQDIYSEAPVTERLYYNIINSLIYITSLANNKLTEDNQPRTKLIVEKTSNIAFPSYAVGCGCSLGVDSLAAIISHMNNRLTPDYNITHLTYFNVGAHGYKKLEASKKSYLKDLKKIKAFAQEINLPIVLVESNICLLFHNLTFDQTGNYINVSTVLSLQKLFKTYLYGSNDPIREFRYDSKMAGYYESMYLPLSSTLSTQLVVANPSLVRSQKTYSIMNTDFVQESLYVCWKELIVNNDPSNPIARIIDNKLNCTRCDKCLRTCLTLDIYGTLSKFDKIFDLQYYYSIRDKYIANVLARKDSSAYYKDMALLLKRHNYPLSLKIKLRILATRLHVPELIGKVRRLRRMLKK